MCILVVDDKNRIYIKVLFGIFLNSDFHSFFLCYYVVNNNKNNKCHFAQRIINAFAHMNHLLLVTLHIYIQYATVKLF